MAKKKSSFYNTRWNRVRINEKRASEVLGVSLDQVLEWDKNGSPELAERYLLLWDKKHVGFTGWDGWLFSRGLLKYKNQQWTPESILYGRAAIARADSAEYELKQLKSFHGIVKLSKSLIFP